MSNNSSLVNSVGAINDNLAYSATESVCGTFNGKVLYRKTISGMLDVSEITTLLPLPGAITLVNAQIYTRGDIQILIPGYYNEANNGRIYFSNQTLYIGVGSAYYGMAFSGFCEYTKD